MSYPRNIELVQPPPVIHTILDFERDKIYSSHEVWEFISKDALHQLAKTMGEISDGISKENGRKKEDCVKSTKAKHKGR